MTAPPAKSRGKLIVTFTLLLAVGGGLIALYFGRELVEARRVRVGLPARPAPATTPAASQH